jgi:hypothetical protein
MDCVIKQINEERALLDELANKVGEGDHLSVNYMKDTAKLQATISKILSLDLKNLDQRIFELAKKLNDMTDKLIDSGEKIYKSNETYLKQQNKLTGALVFATFGLIFATILSAILVYIK